MTSAYPHPATHLLRLTLWCANLLAGLAVLALLAGGAAWVSKQPYFSIKRIQIQPAQSAHFEYVSPASIKTTLADNGGGLSADMPSGFGAFSNFFSVDIAQVRALFETVPWVRQAQVRRVWPDTLHVLLEEHQPLAFWNEDQMLNTWGETFNANQGELADNLTLAHLSGPPQSEPLVVQRYAQLLDMLTPLNLHVQRLTLSARHAWSVELTSSELAQHLHLELGREEALPSPAAMSFNARLQRFARAWPQLSGRLNGRQIRRADLRYPNGFAVTLAPASPRR